MYSVSLKVTLISTNEPLWQAVKSETEAMQVRLNLKANVNEALIDVAQTSVDAVLLESDDLSEVGELKSYLPACPNHTSSSPSRPTAWLSCDQRRSL